MRNDISIQVEGSEFQALAGEAAQLLSASPEWLRWLASEAFEGSHELVELLAVDGDNGSALRAGHLWVLAKPTHKLVLLVAALRAGNGDGSAFVDGHFEHGGPQGGDAGVGTGSVHPGDGHAHAGFSSGAAQ